MLLFSFSEKGITILDLACGSGNFTLAIGAKFPNSTFVGLDYSAKGIELAKDLQNSKGVTNASFVEGNAHHLPQEWAQHFDLVFMNDALHDIPDPNKCLEEVHKVLKDDGFFCLIEVGSHSDPLQNVGNFHAAMLYSIGMFTCTTASLAEPPHVGYGPMWGVEEIEKTLRNKKFELGKDAIVHIKEKACFMCTKVI